jgi:hypothetical protein
MGRRDTGASLREQDSVEDLALLNVGFGTQVPRDFDQVVGAALVPTLGTDVDPVVGGALVPGTVGEDVLSDGVGVNRGAALDVGTGVLVDAGADVVVGAVARRVVGAAGAVLAGWVTPAPVVGVPGAGGCTFRYSVPMARKSTDRMTVDVRARPR